MTDAHVPPRATGNKAPYRERAQWVVKEGGAQLGGWSPGGLSVYGLCRPCNQLTSAKEDAAYVDFHQAVERTSGSDLWRKRHSLPVTVFPGLVARSVLIGMLAIHDGLQDRYPSLARDLRHDDPAISLPHDLRLLLALTGGDRSRIGGPVGYMRVLGQRQFHLPLAEVWYPPLAWCLRTVRSSEPGLGPDLTADWADVTDWIRYDGGFSTDLRNVVGPLPLAALPPFGADGWLFLASDLVVSAMEGRRAQRPGAQT
jgi:hypothetical protein